MPLSFQNLYSETAYVALVWFSPDCSPDPWRKIGWFAVAPNETVEVIADDLRTIPDSNFAWFADTGADGPCWSGDHWYQVPHNAAFNQCYDDNTGCNALWPFIAGSLDTEQYGFTIMLLAPGEPDQANQGCVWGAFVAPPPPPEIVSFRASPSRVRPDQTSTISWVVNDFGVGGTTVTLNGVSVPLTGSQQHGCSSECTFTLEASNAFGSASQSTTIYAGR